MPSIGERLLEERDRLGLSQPALADACRVTMRSQRNYEKGERFPDAAYLAAIAAAGADVRYIITGDRDGAPSEVLSADERELLALFRAAPLAVKAAAIGALQGGSTAPAKAPRYTVQGSAAQQFNAPVSGGVAGRNIIHKTGKKKA